MSVSAPVAPSTEATYFGRWNQGWTRRRSRDEIVAELGLDPSRRTAVLFSHVLWDANMFYGRDLFADQEEWFVESVRAACANDRVNWVVKLHPANVWKRRRDRAEGELTELAAIRDAIGELPPHVHLLAPDNEISTWSLFDVTDWGLTIRGSIGFELPCFGTPVLTAGTGFYSGRGFTVDSATADEYLARLASIEEIPPPSPEDVPGAWRAYYEDQTRCIEDSACDPNALLACVMTTDSSAPWAATPRWFEPMKSSAPACRCSSRSRPRWPPWRAA